MKFSAFATFVRPEAPGAPDFLIERSVRETAIDFCRRTGVYIPEPENITIIKGINEYDVTVQQGLITKVTPLTQIAVDDVPVLTAIGSGDGAILSANLSDRPDFQGEVKQVIDCVS